MIFKSSCSSVNLPVSVLTVINVHGQDALSLILSTWRGLKRALSVPLIVIACLKQLAAFKPARKEIQITPNWTAYRTVHDHT